MPTLVSLIVASTMLAQGVVVPVSVARPTYPPIAATARVSGEVEVRVAVRPDGSVESASVVTGAPLLSQPALDAAKKSRFDCRDCREAASYSLIFAFGFGDTATIGGEVPDSEVVHLTPSRGRVEIVAANQIVIPYFATIKVRSVKCLWLWACGSHWTGKDFYGRHSSR